MSDAIAAVSRTNPRLLQTVQAGRQTSALFGMMTGSNSVIFPSPALPQSVAGKAPAAASSSQGAATPAGGAGTGSQAAAGARAGASAQTAQRPNAPLLETRIQAGIASVLFSSLPTQNQAPLLARTASLFGGTGPAPNGSVFGSLGPTQGGLLGARGLTQAGRNGSLFGTQGAAAAGPGAATGGGQPAGGQPAGMTQLLEAQQQSAMVSALLPAPAGPSMLGPSLQSAQQAYQAQMQAPAVSPVSGAAGSGSRWEWFA